MDSSTALYALLLVFQNVKYKIERLPAVVVG